MISSWKRVFSGESKGAQTWNFPLPPRNRTLSKHWARGYPLTLSWKWKTTPNERKLLLEGNIFHFHDYGRKGQGKSWLKWRFYGVSVNSIEVLAPERKGDPFWKPIIFRLYVKRVCRIFYQNSQFFLLVGSSRPYVSYESYLWRFLPNKGLFLKSTFEPEVCICIPKIPETTLPNSDIFFRVPNLLSENGFPPTTWYESITCAEAWHVFMKNYFKQLRKLEAGTASMAHAIPLAALLNISNISMLKADDTPHCLSSISSCSVNCSQLSSNAGIWLCLLRAHVCSEPNRNFMMSAVYPTFSTQCVVICICNHTAETQVNGYVLPPPAAFAGIPFLPRCTVWCCKTNHGFDRQPIHHFCRLHVVFQFLKLFKKHGYALGITNLWPSKWMTEEWLPTKWNARRKQLKHRRQLQHHRSLLLLVLR